LLDPRLPALKTASTCPGESLSAPGVVILAGVIVSPPPGPETIVKATCAPPTGLPFWSFTITCRFEIPVLILIMAGYAVSSTLSIIPDIIENSMLEPIVVPLFNSAVAVITAMPARVPDFKVAAASPESSVVTALSMLPSVVLKTIVCPEIGTPSFSSFKLIVVVLDPSAIKKSSTGRILRVWPLKETSVVTFVSPAMPSVGTCNAVISATPPELLVRLAIILPSVLVTAV